MLLFRRPKQPKGFSKDAAAALRAVADALAKGQKLDAIHEIWRKEKYKSAFAAAQHDRCGYCETFVGNHPAPMDHHAPKGEVQVLVAEGYEAKDLYNVHNRETPEISATGYHWLALAWSNWLLACERCNTGWKRSLFPVQEDLTLLRAVDSVYRIGGIKAVEAFLAASAPPPPHPRREITPLLLHPFGPKDPVDHLEFSERGEITPRAGSDQGRATIRTCGLHRESLRRTRHRHAADAFRHIGRLEDALAHADLRTAVRASEDLLSLGAENSAHAGMIRSIVLSRLLLRWPEFEALAKGLEKRVALGARPRR